MRNLQLCHVEFKLNSVLWWWWWWWWWWWCHLCTRPTRFVEFAIIVAYWNNSPRVDISLYSDTLSWFQANQSLFFLLNAAWRIRGETTNISLLLSWQERSSNPRSTALDRARRSFKSLHHRYGSYKRGDFDNKNKNNNNIRTLLLLRNCAIFCI